MGAEIRQNILDCCILGAGPAGLTCAGVLARAGLTVTVLEKQSQAGLKLLTTGGGRCNIMCSEDDPDELAHAFGTFPDELPSSGRLPVRPPQIRSLFRSWPPETVRDFIQSDAGLGIPLVKDEEGKFFPQAQSARMVRDALLDFAQDAHIRCGTEVSGLSPGPEGDFVLELKDGSALRCRHAVFACGGAAWPKTGSNGSLAGLLAPLGYQIQPWLPSLGGLEIPQLQVIQGMSPRAGKDFFPRCAGTVLETGLRIRLAGQPGVKPLEFAQGRGTTLFTHTGLSGPGVLAQSGTASWLMAQGRTPWLEMDLLPDLAPDDLAESLEQRRTDKPHSTLGGFFGSLLPGNFAKTFMDAVGIDPAQNLSGLRKADRQLILSAVKSLSFRIGGIQDLNQAIQSLGGIRVQDISWPDMKLKFLPGAYALGDCISLDRPTGGYSLSLCWASAWGAARSIIKESGREFYSPF